MRTFRESTANFEVFKANLTEYRVKDLKTGIITNVGENLILHNVYAKTDLAAYEIARKNNFKNSGIESDYFACLVCERYEIKQEPNLFHRIKDCIFFNPFKSAWFMDRETGARFRPYTKLKFVLIQGNTLKYVK